jgi:hypothetical protein
MLLASLGLDDKASERKVERNSYIMDKPSCINVPKTKVRKGCGAPFLLKMLSWSGISAIAQSACAAVRSAYVDIDYQATAVGSSVLG